MFNMTDRHYLYTVGIGDESGTMQMGYLLYIHMVPGCSVSGAYCTHPLCQVAPFLVYILHIWHVREEYGVGWEESMEAFTYPCRLTRLMVLLLFGPCLFANLPQFCLYNLWLEGGVSKGKDSYKKKMAPIAILYKA